MGCHFLHYCWHTLEGAGGLQQPRCARLAGSQPRALAFDAVAPPSESSVAPLDAQQRAALAEELGYRTIGAELPEDVSLGDVIQSMPKSVSPRSP